MEKKIKHHCSNCALDPFSCPVCPDTIDRRVLHKIVYWCTYWKEKPIHATARRA